MLTYLTLEQAASLLGCTEEEVRALVARGELDKGADGIPGDQVALLIMERQAEAPPRSG